MSTSSISAPAVFVEGNQESTVGDPALDFTLPATRDREVTLSSFLGNQNVVLVFYKSGFPSAADI